MKILCKIGLHRYEQKAYNSMTKYLQCTKCGKRTYKQGLRGHQPLDKEWLNGADREPLETTYKTPGGECYICPTPDKDPRNEE